MAKEKWVFRRYSADTYYNGSSEWVWSDNPNVEVAFPNLIRSKYIFASKQEAEESELYKNDALLRQRFYICNVADCQYKPKSIYTPYLQHKPTIHIGRQNEHCSLCGQNIIADEEYVKWTNNKIICLHCIMSYYDKFSGIYKNIPRKYKMEWNRNGTEDFEKIAKDFL